MIFMMFLLIVQVGVQSVLICNRLDKIKEILINKQGVIIKKLDEIYMEIPDGKENTGKVAED